MWVAGVSAAVKPWFVVCVEKFMKLELLNMKPIYGLCWCGAMKVDVYKFWSLAAYDVAAFVLAALEKTPIILLNILLKINNVPRLFCITKHNFNFSY